MKFFIDSADINEIREGNQLGWIDGVTTNPTLIAKANRPQGDVIKDICREVRGPVSAEVISLQKDKMYTEGLALAKIHDQVVVKIPLCEDGLAAAKKFAADGIRTHLTLIFSPLQALLAAKAGATYISPFVGRLDDIGNNGMELIESIAHIYRTYDFKTEILVASVRHPVHVLESAMIGAGIVTMPLKVMRQLAQHPLTEKGIQQFLEDAAKTPKQ